MARPKPVTPAPDPASDKGAPAALRRLETRELEESEAIERAREELNDARLGGDKTEIAKAEAELLGAFDRWNKIAKTLLSFDKGVAPEKREGEKIPKAEAEQYFTLYARHARVAVEQMILSVAQDAMQCTSPEQFYSMASARFRGTFHEGMSTAHREGKIPAWVHTAAEIGL